MAPLIALLTGSMAARIVGWLGVDYVDTCVKAIAVGLAAMFVLTGVAHFVPPLRASLIAIVPPRLPAPGLLVSFTGVLELFGAVGLLVPATRIAATVCLLLLMFPANIYAARMLNPPKSMTTRLPLRTAEEIVYLAAAVMVAIGGS
jgi:uncharacterized membrane protein